MVLALLTWPLLLGVYALCIRFNLPRWVAGIAAIVLIFSGLIFCCCTALASWHLPSRKRAWFLYGSIVLWGAVGKAFPFWFGHLIKEVAK